MFFADHVTVVGFVPERGGEGVGGFAAESAGTRRKAARRLAPLVLRVQALGAASGRMAARHRPQSDGWVAVAAGERLPGHSATLGPVCRSSWPH